SRYCGLWVGMIALADTMDSTATVDVADGPRIVLPERFEMPADGVHIRLGDTPLAQEERLYTWRLPAARAFARANDLNPLVVPAPGAKLGVVATGKAFLDVRQALAELGMVTEDEIAAAGIRLLKVGMPWPLDDTALRAFATGLEHVLVVEEKRPLIEDQMRSLLYGMRDGPRITGKLDADGKPQLQTAGELSPAKVARALAKVLPPAARGEGVERYLQMLLEREKALFEPPPKASRQPLFCAGCPHNRSTKVPDGSRAMAGIGCHYMAQWNEPHTDLFTQMGGEGTPWIGQAPFTDTPHVFTNIGDGTWFHSGILAVRAAVAAKVNITYKLLFNDAVAMTGGQHVDGTLTVPGVIAQLRAEGVARIEVVADDPDRHPRRRVSGIAVRHRDEMDGLQQELRATQGVSVIVYDQVCATELRRRRKRGKAAPAATKVLINEAVCEGCGDCSEQSQCVAVEPLATEHGYKRSINQSACNSDLSCLRGFCPSFVTIAGGALRKPDVGAGVDAASLAGRIPEPDRAGLEVPMNLVITGVGGTGIVTVSQILAMAAHLDGNAAVTLDMTGLAQKGGSVFSHVRIGSEPDVLHTTRVAAGRADLLLACDPVTAASPDALTRISPQHTTAVVNTHVAPTADFVLHRTVDFDEANLLQRIRRHSGTTATLDATGLAERLLGDAVGANLLALGHAWQIGLIPVSLAAIERAIEMNGVAVAMNQAAFQLGRLTAHAPDDALLSMDQAAAPTAMDPPKSLDLDARIEARAQELETYQDAALAEQYRNALAGLRSAEARGDSESERLSEAVTEGLFRVLSPKDEYEVARLYADGRFSRKLMATFDGGKVRVHLAPPMLGFLKDATGRPRKFGFGPWVLGLFSLLARCKGLRGTWLDPFRFSADRKLERALAAEYQTLLAEIERGLNEDNLDAAVRLAASIQQVSGFGPVREANAEAWRKVLPALLADFRSPTSPVRVMEPQSAA
ncbi:MAG: indolepyruvate ferredoxin oxidoreductase family protein, partial [Gammaproteobacteria bacterium]|nr:indolepyruvate ferredoxin oxidoreductase family protein [Gammaproteobacteria bacterium]